MRAPPRGLEVVAGTLRDPSLYDTTVMANYGYFQLKVRRSTSSCVYQPALRPALLHLFHISRTRKDHTSSLVVCRERLGSDTRQGNPGTWRLRIAEGRSSSLYENEDGVEQKVGW